MFKQTNNAFDYLIFSELRAIYKRLSFIDYRLFISVTETNLYSNPSNFYKCTRDLKQHAEIPSSVSFSGEVTNRPLSSTNLFSKFFAFIFSPPLATFANANPEKNLS